MKRTHPMHSRRLSIASAFDSVDRGTSVERKHDQGPHWGYGLTRSPQKVDSDTTVSSWCPAGRWAPQAMHAPRALGPPVH